MTQKLRIAFMGTPDFAVPALNALVEAGHDVVAVYTQPPRPANRGEIKTSPVQARGEELGIETRHPTSLKNAEEQQAFADLNLDIAVVAAYGLILPKEILDAPKYGCLNIHASLLPRWRGAAPIQRAILEGDTETGICIMQMDEGLDTGDVLAREATPITSTTTSTDLHDTLSNIGADLICDVVEKIASGNAPTPEPQPEEGMTYASMLSREDGQVDWTKSATEIERQIRALTPWPGCWFTLKNNERVKLHAVEITQEKGNPGEILDSDMSIACGEGALKLTSLQPANKKPMSGRDFLNGSDLKVGDIL